MEKKCTQNPYFLQKFDFCIFEPKNCEVIVSSSKAVLYFSPLKCTYLGKFISISLALGQEKIRLKSGHLELRFSVYI